MSFINRIVKFWRIQIALAREWRPESRHRGRRLLLVWVVDSLALLFVVWLLPGVQVRSVVGVVATAAVLGLANAFIRPVLIYIALPLAFVTGGLFALVINAWILLLVAEVGGVHYDSFMWALLASLLLVLANTVMSFFVNLDDDDSFYFNLMKRMAREQPDTIKTDRPGLVIIQVDGLAAPIIRQAVRTGTVPFVASLIRSGKMRLVEWEAGLPSNTPASQAGILHGNNAGIPAFRWYEKESGRILVANHSKDAAEIEARIATRRGLLADRGTSLTNLFSGQATTAFLTNSRMGEVRGDVRGASSPFYSFLLSPYALTRTIILAIRELIIERYQARRQVQRQVVPRVHRGLAFAGMRAASVVVFPDIVKTMIVNGMYTGENVIYADVLSYDELAHHVGPERPETLGTLEGIDSMLRSLHRAAEGAPRPYEFAVVSDHGQSMGSTFLQRYGVKLQDLVSQLIAGNTEVIAGAEDEESWGKVDTLLGEVIKAPGITAAATRRMLGKRVAADGTVQVGAHTPEEIGAAGGAAPSEETRKAIVLASGNFATIHFTAATTRMTLEEIEALYPGLVTSLAAHPGIGFLMVRSREHGPVVIGRDGTRLLADDTVRGEDPLRHLTGHPADHLRRVDSYPNCADICVNSLFDPETEEVAAFEEQVGCHGGLGGYQTRPFVAVPADWDMPDAPLIGAESIYEIFRTRIDKVVLSPVELAAAASRPPTEPEPGIDRPEYNPGNATA